ncbi:MAG: LPS export ABC transporter permease LptF [Hahellaceae bacterium]|nr:LPS export ABC transporter permease LptF [Hahellaceae bacterium]
MNIVFRYLARQVLISMTAVSGILLLVFMSGRFIKYLAQAAAGGISADVLFTLMGYRLPEFLQLILPLGLFIGILLAYGRMYLESEMTVLFACGYSERKLVMQTLGASMIVSVIVGVMSLWFAPEGIKQVEALLTDQTRMTEFEMLAPGRFQALRSGGRVTYTESLSDDKRQLNNVFISETGKTGNTVAVLTARTGTQIIDQETGSRFLVLKNGRRFEGVPGQADYRVVEFESYGVRIERPEGERRSQRDEAIPTSELFGSDVNKHKALLQWRISMPLLVPIVALLAIPLSRVNPRQGRFFHLLPAMLIYVGYLGLLIVARNKLEKGKIPEWIGVWAVHFVFFSIAMFLNTKGSIMRYFVKRRQEAVLNASS